MRKYLVVALGLALVLGAANVAFAANTQELEAAFLPKKAPKHRLVGGSIEVTATTGTASSKIAPPTDAKTFFDNDLSFDFMGLPQCDPAKIGDQPTSVARNTCRAALVGTGDALTAINGNPDPKFQIAENVLAFNGTPKGGEPTLVLHSYAPTLGLTVVTVGVISSTKGKFGHVLDIRVPPLPLNSALIRFHVKVKRNFHFKGRTHHYLLGSCAGADHTWHFRSAFKYSGAAPRSANADERCTVTG